MYLIGFDECTKIVPEERAPRCRHCAIQYICDFCTDWGNDEHPVPCYTTEELYALATPTKEDFKALAEYNKQNTPKRKYTRRNKKTSGH